MGSARRTFVPVVVVPLALNILPVVAELLGLGSYGFVAFLLALLGTALGAVAACVAWFTRKRRHALIFGVAGATLALTAYPCLRLSEAARRWAFSALAERSHALVSAIDAYARKHGAPPESLQALVPEHLERVPSTGMLAYPTYQYSVPSADTPVMLHWYDLGSRDGAPFRGLWKYPDGEKGHAILVVLTARDDSVSAADVDRMGATAPALAFDAATWRREPSARARMVGELRRTVLARGQKFRDVLAALGPPQGQRVLVDTPWELLVPCSRGLLNWDVFFYWPGQRYPAAAYGGSIERIRDWAYVHE